MEFLHPDKLASVAKIMQDRPSRNGLTAEQQAIAAAARPVSRLTPREREQQHELLGNLAYNIYHNREMRLYDRMARHVAKQNQKAAAQKAIGGPKQGGGGVTITINPGGGNVNQT